MNLEQKVPLSRKHLLLLVYVTCVFSGWTQSACSQDKKAQVKKAQVKKAQDKKVADKKAQDKKVADKKAQDKKALQKKAGPGKKTGQGKSQAKPKSTISASFFAPSARFPLAGFISGEFRPASQLSIAPHSVRNLSR